MASAKAGTGAPAPGPRPPAPGPRRLLAALAPNFHQILEIPASNEFSSFKVFFNHRIVLARAVLGPRPAPGAAFRGFQWSLLAAEQHCTLTRTRPRAFSVAAKRAFLRLLRFPFYSADFLFINFFWGGESSSRLVPLNLQICDASFRCAAFL